MMTAEIPEAAVQAAADVLAQWDRGASEDATYEMEAHMVLAAALPHLGEMKAAPSTARPPRRPGSPWRLLAHQWLGRKGDLPYGTAYDITNNPADVKAHERIVTELGLDPSLSETTLIEGTEFDELVVGRWLHIEQMDTSMWWMTIGGVVLHVWADRDGRPKHVTVHGPGCWDLPEPGCKYELDWRKEADHG